MARGFWTGLAVVLVAAGVAFVLLAQPFTPGPAAPEGGAHTPAVSDQDGASAAAPLERPLLRGTPRAPSTAPPTRSPSAGGDEGTLFTGKVVDAAGEPVAAARVEAVTTEGVSASVLTDGEGIFRYRLLVTDTIKERPGTVRAYGADGSVGQVPLYFVTRRASRGLAPEADPDTPRDVGTIRLGAPHDLDVRVVSQCHGAPPCTLWIVSPAFGIAVPWTVLETDAQGLATFRGVPAGRWMLIAGAPGCGRARAPVQLPREAVEPVVMELPEAHTLTVRVRDAEDSSPIAGAVVHVSEQVRLPAFYTQGPLISAPSSYTTDAEGVARLDALGGSETLYLSTEAEGYPLGSEHGRGRGQGPGEARVEPGQAEVVIELHKALTVRWPIKNEGIGIPADGTEVVLEPWTNTGRLTVPPTGVIENQEVVVEGWGSDGASGYAVIPERGIARLSAGPGEAKGYPTAFYPLRRIDLVLRWADGTPAQGWFLVVRDGGNNAVKPATKTDEDGRAAMEGLYGGLGSLVNVSASDSGERTGFAFPLGSVNLMEGDGHFEAEIPAERALRVRLTIEGRPVPKGFLGRPTLNGGRFHRTEEVDAEGDPGLFEVAWRPVKTEGDLFVSARAHRYLAETEKLTFQEVSPSREVGIDLRPAGSLRIEVTEPEDKRYRIAIDRWHPEENVWSTPGAPRGFSSGRGRRADANGLVVLKNLEPGRYRVVETLSGLTSEGVEVRAGGAPTEIAFDASGTGWVRGRVAVPEGFTWDGVTVGAIDAEPEGYSVLMAGAAALPGAHVNRKDGTFWFRVNGARPITLRPYHAMLLPHPTRGQVTMTGPQDDVVLELVRAATATVRFSMPAPVLFNPGRHRPISVRLYDGPAVGPGTQLSGMLDGEHSTVEFGGYQPGTYTVWIDAPGSAPVVLPNVTLGTEDVDLGVVDLSAGATFELQVTVKEGQSPPRYAVWLQRVDEPSYTRHTDRAGATISISGLGAGRFRVSATAYNGAAPGIQEEIEFDGQTKVVRTIDAR